MNYKNRTEQSGNDCLQMQGLQQGFFLIHAGEKVYVLSDVHHGLFDQFCMRLVVYGGELRIIRLRGRLIGNGGATAVRFANVGPTAPQPGHPRLRSRFPVPPARSDEWEGLAAALEDEKLRIRKNVLNA